jgi:carboxyl-terminal processing protease
MTMKRSALAPLLVAGMALATGGWFLQRGVSQEQNVYVNAKLFQEVVNHISDRFVDPKPPANLYEMAIDGLLQELGDPHTAFMTPKDYGQLKVSTQGEYGGLGIQIDKRDGWITVITPMPGTPAERAGVQSGDQIIEFNGKTTKPWSTDDAVDQLRGPKGTTVELKVMRIGMDQPITFKITRDEIHIKAVPNAYMLENGIGYVDLVVFSESSTDELRAAITDLRKQGAKGIVLDMRANPGGLLDQGVTVSDLFLNRGQLVVETRSRVPGQNLRSVAEDPDEYPGLPIAVLVGPGSASAAEIVAGALQDHDRALVIGRTSYGKGSVQQVFHLSNNNYLKMTTARWFTPSGRSIQRPYGIGAEHSATAEDGVPDAPTTVNDSTRKPTYKTDSGRIVYGGGGIHPDVVVLDTLTAAERVLVEVLQKNTTKYVDTRYRYGTRYARAHPELQPGFAVTPQMLSEFYSALQEAGLAVDRTIYDKGSEWIAGELGYEISLAKWGNQGARKRLNAQSAEIRVAVELLRKAPTPKALFQVAETYNAQHKAVATQGKSTPQQ